MRRPANLAFMSLIIVFVVNLWSILKWQTVYSTPEPLARTIHEIDGISLDLWFHSKFFLLQISVSISCKKKIHCENKSLRDMLAISWIVRASASHLTLSPSARGGPRFSGDRATCLALLTLGAESSWIMQVKLITVEEDITNQALIAEALYQIV